MKRIEDYLLRLLFQRALILAEYEPNDVLQKAYISFGR